MPYVNLFLFVLEDDQRRRSIYNEKKRHQRGVIYVLVFYDFVVCNVNMSVDLYSRLLERQREGEKEEKKYT